MSIDSTKPTPPRSVQDALAGYKTKAERMESRANNLEAELRTVRHLLNEANAENRAMDSQLAGLGDDARRRYQAALARSEADPGKREHAAVVHSTRAAVDSYTTITRRTSG